MTKPASPPVFEPYTRTVEWADPDAAQLSELFETSQERGWREALRSLPAQHGFFTKRLHNFSLGNWHLLLSVPRDRRALDVGCGWGSLSLGLAEYYRQAIGVDALWSRVAFANLRARQEPLATSSFARASAQCLPFSDGAIDLVTLNGVLEWAALHAHGEPRCAQRDLLREIKRVLVPEGVVAVAIENRFALETLVGMPDTHTGLRLVPALPRLVARLVSRLARGESYRTYLYSQSGYATLVREAGFAQVRAYGLLSSYNDYDFIVAPSDAASFRLLWDRRVVRTFHRRAGSVRQLLARVRPEALGSLVYAYLVVGGDRVHTMLDPEHEVWARAARYGVPTGRYRFACQGAVPGSLAILAHDGRRVLSAVEVGVSLPREPAPAAVRVIRAGNESLVPAGAWSDEGTMFRCYSTAS